MLQPGKGTMAPGVLPALRSFLGWGQLLLQGWLGLARAGGNESQRSPRGTPKGLY